MIRLTWILVLWTCTSLCHAQSPEIVQRITQVDLQVLLSKPPHLVVRATGLVPTMGYSETRLLRAQYLTPPSDGVQDFFLVSTPPAMPAAGVITEVSASDRINEFKTSLPWLRGVRVHGTGYGVITKMLADGLRIRKNIVDLSPAELEVFKRGVQAMKSRPVTDRRSWSFQANIHGENTPASDPLWNRCEHGTLHFLTWHRAYLLEFERILREASGDDSFTLPYWDWSTARALPAAFRDSDSPLFEPGRTINGGQLLPTSVVVDDLASAIGGLAFQDFSFDFEGSPHGAVHVLVGGRMSSVPTAANDPIFWLHHCQIDRVWDSWLALAGGRENPADTAFLDRDFTFVGPSGSPVTHRVGRLLDSASLGYRYADLSGSQQRSVPTPSVGPMFTMVSTTSGQPEDANQSLVASSEPARAPATAETAEHTAKKLGLSVERVVMEPREEALPRLSAAAAAAAPASEERIVIDIVGLNAEDTPRFTYSVYLNLPAGDVSDEVKKLYRVSTLNFFGLGKDHAEHDAQAAGNHDARDNERERRQRFDATRTVARLREAGLWKDAELSVTLEPLTPISTQGDDPELSNLLSQSAETSKITYERIDVRVLEK